jgi:DNA invertase Pin-like site-specific DNA recombinase
MPARRPLHRWWDEQNDRAMLICRISDRKQKDGVSLEAQDHHGREYAERVGLRVIIAKPFQESAKKSQLRAEFHAAIDEARRQRIKHLVFYVWDRITRNFTDAEMLEEMIRDGEIVVHIASGGTVLHADSDDSEFFLFDINVAQAKQDNRNRRRKTIDGMEQRCRNGWYPSRTPSFYVQVPALDENGRPKRRGGTVAGPTEEGRRLVRREVDLHLKGFSLEAIRRKCLAESLVPAKCLATYTATLIDKHLKNIFYSAIPKPYPDPDKPSEVFKSQFVWRGKRYDAKHEPIIGADEWSRLQASFGLRSAQRVLKHHGLFAEGPLMLTCATEGCGCKITYAPKTKPSGVTYHYYRCADGRYMHRGKDQPQVNVKEQDILEQLVTAADAIEITAAFAEAIARALNETHRAATEAKKKSADVYRAELRALEEKENRIFDRFDSGEIDRSMFDTQVARVRESRRECFEKLREADTEIDTAYLDTARDVLELAKDARSLLEGRSREEKRDFLARLVCNPRLDGRTVRFDLKKPFAVIAKMRAANDWRPQRESNL